jgi:hypothetical protein
VRPAKCGVTTGPPLIAAADFVVGASTNITQDRKGYDLAWPVRFSLIIC